jgi:voltage-gated potassium channel
VRPPRPILYGIALLGAVVVVGTVGFVLIEGVSAFDAFYMVVITVSTVGFGYEFPLSPMGEVWTLLIIVMGIGVALYTAIASFEYLIDIGEIRRRKKMERDISRLSGHVIVCGWGRVGRGVWATLRDRDVTVVAIESDPARAEAAAEAGVVVIRGDATHNDVIELAGVENAAALIACVADDSDNLVIALSVKSITPDLRVICRATEVESERKLRLAGADAVVAPQAVGAERLAMMALQPELAQIFDVVINGNAVEFRVEELDVSPGSAVANKTIRESGIRQTSGAQILAIEGENQTVVVNPEADRVLASGERLVVVGTKEQVDRAAEMLRPTS